MTIGATTVTIGATTVTVVATTVRVRRSLATAQRMHVEHDAFDRRFVEAGVPVRHDAHLRIGDLCHHRREIVAVQVDARREAGTAFLAIALAGVAVTDSELSTNSLRPGATSAPCTGAPTASSRSQRPAGSGPASAMLSTPQRGIWLWRASGSALRMPRVTVCWIASQLRPQIQSPAAKAGKPGLPPPPAPWRAGSCRR